MRKKMDRADYESFATRVTQKLGSVISGNENADLFFFCNKQPSVGYCTEYFDGTYCSLRNPGTKDQNYKPGPTYYVGIRTEADVNYLTRQMVHLLFDYLKELWEGVYYDENFESDRDVIVVRDALCKKFSDKFTEKTQIDLGLLDDLSLLKYEGAKCRGSLLFLEETQASRVTTQIEPAQPIFFCTDELRRIRKLMAGSSEKSVLAFCRQKDVYDPEGEFICQGYTDAKDLGSWKVKIVAPRQFIVCLGNKQLFRMNRMLPELVLEKWPGQLQTVCDIFSIKERVEAKIFNLLEKINSAGHGAAVVFLNLKKGSYAEERIQKLKQLDRGYGIRGRSVASHANMDGAIVVDVRTGKINSIGVILDGSAWKEGDMSRGARHNSLDAFCADFHVQCATEHVAAIVFSEDGGSSLYFEKATAKRHIRTRIP